MKICRFPVPESLEQPNRLMGPVRPVRLTCITPSTTWRKYPGGTKSGALLVDLGCRAVARLETHVLPETVEVSETALEPLYRVLIHNDDVTPMDFVVSILERIFFLSQPEALEIMYTAHFKGLAYVQTLPKTEAQTRINKAHFAAGLEGYPLHFSMEPE